MDTYGAQGISRTPVPAPNVWTAVIIPIGGRGAYLALENPATAFRVSPDNTLNPLTEGIPVPANGGVWYEGTSTAAQTVYVSAAAIGVAALYMTFDS
jgi:hypothetical protein